MWVPFLEGPPPEIWEGEKNVQNSARFLTTFDFDRECVRKSEENKSGSVFVFVTSYHDRLRFWRKMYCRNCLAAGLRLDPLEELTALQCPRLPSWIWGGEGWQRKTAGQREGERVRKWEKGVCAGREGWGGKEESKGKSGCAPPETKSWMRHCTKMNDVGWPRIDLER